MKISGKIIQALSLQSGVSKNGNNWSKQEYILETTEQYPKQICFSIMGDNIAKLNIQVGQVLDVSVDISSREYNGRWYTSINAWNATPQQPIAPAQPQQPYGYAPAPGMQDDPFANPNPYAQ